VKQKRVLSGIQPSGKLHLGNFIGAVQNWTKLQEQYDCIFFIADLHALTTSYEDIKKLPMFIKDAAVDLLASGIDPKKSVLFKQSDVPEHSELHLLFSMITPLSWLERVPTYKSKIDEVKGKDLGTYGFLGYPVLQAADILIYKSDYVPVGEDQLPHIELTREIARRFNFYYGKVFPEPKELLTNFPVLPGIDGRKMSKSYDNCIYLGDSAATVEKKVMTLVTDPARKLRSDKGHPEVCPVYFYHRFCNAAAAETVASECRNAERGCVDCKREMAAKLNEFLAPVREKRAHWESRKDEVRSILDAGTSRADAIARQTLDEALRAVGLRR